PALDHPCLSDCRPVAGGVLQEANASIRARCRGNRCAQRHRDPARALGILEVLYPAAARWPRLEQEASSSGVLRYGFEFASAYQEAAARPASPAVGSGC